MFRTLGKLPRGIWGLGLTSLFMDVSSELIHSVLPIFMNSVLGTGMVTIGLIEGTAEATASITKVFSGALSDRWRKRKPLAVLGYGLAALTKPIFPLAGSIGWVAAARFTDRVGKGIRGAPRDALVAEIAPEAVRGAAYGLRQALDSAGALLGPAIALVALAAIGGAIRTVLWIATIPAVISVVMLLVLVREPETAQASGPPRHARFAGLEQLPRRFWWVVGLGFVFTLARFSEAFLILRAQDVGFPLMYVPAVMIVMNGVYTLGAYPAGAASDNGRSRTLLVAGLSSLIVADLLLARAAGPLGVLLGTAFWGLHMALTQGLLSKLVADSSPAALRGTAFGVFNLGVGVASLLASLIAGALWSSIGPAATFYAGAAFAAISCAGLIGYAWRSKDRTRPG